MKWYLHACKYTHFSGRSSVRAYWMFQLFHTIVFFGIFFAMGYALTWYSGQSPAPGELFSPTGNTVAGITIFVYLLISFKAALAVTVRRLHDTGKSAWWLLIVFIPVLGFIIHLVFMIQKGEQGENRFGSDPREVDGPETAILEGIA